MGIRKPSKSVNEIRFLADRRSQTDDKTEKINESSDNAPTQNELEALKTASLQEQVISASSKLETVLSRPSAKTGKICGETSISTVDAQQRKPASPKTKRSVWKPASNNSTILRRKTDHSSAFQEVHIDKMQVYVSAELPAPGISDTYDLVSQHYPPQKALQMILRKALQDYDFVLENGKFIDLAEIYPVDVAAQGYVVQTSRMMSKELYQIARAHFDPLGLESTRSFGKKLAAAALATFFSHELKQTISLD